MERVIVIVFLLGVCCLAFVGPDQISTEMWREWRIAQNELVQPKWGLGTKPFQIPPTLVRWVPRTTSFLCGDVLTDGCYNTARIIEWNINVPTVIRNEAGHAILNILGDARWSCYEHAPPKDAPECWENPR